MDKNRKLSQRKYDSLYENLILLNDSDEQKCFYCGLDATTIDHQPPISVIGSFIDNNEIFEALKIPCCLECNSLLHSTPTKTLYERLDLLKTKLRNKYKEEVKMCGVWDEEEIEDMGFSLKNMVKASIEIGIEAENRILYRGHKIKEIIETWHDSDCIKFCEYCEIYYDDTLCPYCEEEIINS